MGTGLVPYNLSMAFHKETLSKKSNILGKQMAINHKKIYDVPKT